MYSDVFLSLFTSKFPKANLIIQGLVKIDIRRENVIIPKELEKKSTTKPKINVKEKLKQKLDIYSLYFQKLKNY